MGEAPWTVRVAEIKAKAAVNLDAEHKVTQLNEELQNMMRAIRIRVRTSLTHARGSGHCICILPGQSIG